MKNSKKLSDAMGQIDQKYIDEYVNTKNARRPMVWRTVTAAALAVAILAGAVIAFPYMNRTTEQGDTLPGTNNLGLVVSTPEDGTYITDAAGNRVLHFSGTTQLPDSFTLDKMILEEAEMVVVNWDFIIPSAQQSTSPDELIFIGTPISKDVYVWEREETVSGEEWAVEYDYASGTTALKLIKEGEPYQAIRRTMVQLVGVRIDEILKENNTTGYAVGDTIYFYSETARTIEPDASDPIIPDLDIETEIVIQPAVGETAILPPVPGDDVVTAAESQPYIPSGTTAAPAFTPTTGADAVTTVPELDYNGDGRVDEIDKEAVATTLPSSGQRLYIANVNTKGVSDIVRESGIVPEQLWRAIHSCTAEEYRSGKFPNDISNMP